MCQGAEKRTLGEEKRTLGAEKRTLGAEKRTLGAEKRTLGAEKRNCTLGPPYLRPIGGPDMLGYLSPGADRPRYPYSLSPWVSISVLKTRN